MSRAIVKKYDELRVFVGYLSDTRSERPIQHIIDNHTQWATTKECKPMSHHERTLLHRTRRAQGHSCIASIKSISRAEATYHSTCGGSNAAVERALRKLAKQLGVKLQDLKVCFEAGPTGFVLGRRLIQLGVECVL